MVKRDEEVSSRSLRLGPHFYVRFGPTADFSRLTAANNSVATTLRYASDYGHRLWRSAAMPA